MRPKRPVRGVARRFFWWAMGVLAESGQQPGEQPSGAALPGHPLVVLVLRRALGVTIASGSCIGSDGILRSILVPLRRSPHLGDTGRRGGFADALQDGPNIHRLGDEGDNPHLGPAPWAGQRKCLVDARQPPGMGVSPGTGRAQ